MIRQIKNDNRDYIKFNGRHYHEGETEWFAFSSSGFTVEIEGTYLFGDFFSTNSEDDFHRPFIIIEVDGKKARKMGFTDENGVFKDGKYFHKDFNLIDELPKGKHRITIYKVSEATSSSIGLLSLKTDGEFLPIKEEKKLKIEFYGDSHTCGYGVNNREVESPFETIDEDSNKAFAVKTAKKLDADFSLVAASGYPLYKSIYAMGNNPDNVPDLISFADPYGIPWDNNKFIPDVVVIALGANDRTYISDSEEENKIFISLFKNKYIDFLTKLNDLYPDAKIIISNEINEEGKTEKIIESAKDDVYQFALKKGFKVYRFKTDIFDKIKDKSYCAMWHPNEEMHQAFASDLADFIKRIL